jgi:hypothetical protein
MALLVSHVALFCSRICRNCCFWCYLQLEVFFDHERKKKSFSIWSYSRVMKRQELMQQKVSSRPSSCFDYHVRSRDKYCKFEDNNCWERDIIEEMTPEDRETTTASGSEGNNLCKRLMSLRVRCCYVFLVDFLHHLHLCRPCFCLILMSWSQFRVIFLYVLSMPWLLQLFVFFTALLDVAWETANINRREESVDEAKDRYLRLVLQWKGNTMSWRTRRLHEKKTE